MIKKIQLNEYQRYVREFFGNRPEEAFEHVGCLFGCPAEESVRCFFRYPGLDVWRCKCGMVWNANPPTQAILDEFYAKSKALEVWSQIKESEAERVRQAKKFGRAIETLKRDGVISVLDIGAGNGVFLKSYFDAVTGAHVDGTEMSPEAIQAARQKGIYLTQDTLEQLVGKGQSFDVVTFWGVLEHLKDPKEALSMARQLAGKVMVCVPNVESTVVRMLGKSAFTFCPQHLWYFNPDTLARLLQLYFFDVKSQWTIEPEIEPILKHQALFDDPYRKDLPEWTWDTQKPIQYPISGYKIVMYGTSQYFYAA